jgi:hypothetical protein
MIAEIVNFKETAKDAQKILRGFLEGKDREKTDEL